MVVDSLCVKVWHMIGFNPIISLHFLHCHKIQEGVFAFISVYYLLLYTFYTQGILIIRYIKITLSPNLYLKLKDRVWLFSCIRVGYFKDMRWESSVLAPCVPNNFWLTDDLRLVIRCELSPKSSDISDGMNRKRIKILMTISVWDSPLEASVILA